MHPGPSTHPSLNVDEIEYAPPYQNGLPASRPSLVSGYDSPTPEFNDSADYDPDIKPQLPPRNVIPDPLQSLLDLPILRPIPWKEGQELPPAKSTEHARNQVRGAVLMTTRGDVAENPCIRCARGTGRFTKCIAKEGWFLGACATCQMIAKGNQCSFRVEKEAAFKAKAKGKADSRAAAREPSDQYPGDTVYVNGPSSKRRRVSEKASSHKQPRTSGYQEYDDYQPPAGEEGHSYEKTFDDNPTALLQYVYKQQQVNINGRNKRHHQQYLTERDEHMQDMRVRKYHRHDARPESYQGEDGEGSHSPAVPYGGQLNEDRLGGSHSHHEQHPASEPVPLIDTFPSKKQNQLFAIIGNLQSGIRTSRQQTENLQKQLDSLQTILGIDPEEADYS